MIWRPGNGEPGAVRGVFGCSGSSHVPGYPVRAVPLAAVIPSPGPGRSRGAWGGSASEGGQAGSIRWAPAPPGHGGGGGEVGTSRPGGGGGGVRGRSGGVKQVGARAAGSRRRGRLVGDLAPGRGGGLFMRPAVSGPGAGLRGAAACSGAAPRASPRRPRRGGGGGG